MKITNWIFRINSYNINEELKISEQENDLKRVKDEGSRFLQYTAGICACISMAAWGSFIAWPSPAIPHLTSNSSAFPVTKEQGSLIISLYNLGDLFGGLINPLFIDRIGRKYTLLLFSLPGLVGWILIIFANNCVYLYIARFIAGVGQGSTFNSLVIYLTEISEKSIRGILINMMHMSMITGIFVFTIVATYTSYNVLNFASATLPILFLLMFPFLPETPYYYLMKGRNEDSMKCLMKLRGICDPNQLTSEIDEMRLAIEEEKKLKTSNFRELINKSHNRRGLLIIFFLKMTQLLSGIVAILAYAQEIFAKSNLSINPGVQVIIVNGISLLACFATHVIIERFNRRTLFLSTGLLASLCLGSVSLFFFMELYLEADVSSISFVPLVALVCFQIVYQFGLGTVPYIVQGELFPMNVKGSAVACGMVMGSCFAFATTAGYSVLSNAAGIYTTFFFFATTALLGSVITFWIMPETKGRSLEEIQAMQNPKLKEKLDSERKINKSVN
ncbi:facilitated trehalose transporter Tret1-like [Belonocnema kinseyi]|uniref:facilitated trehalose transporter Tret1-like n=1 Tax=Belonocnema kinseyi TaxID=2817044 RepID=UPI00143D1700|nr:facilitated trehalose transporter Tret1-like [Belonocnema kinseyi]